MKRIAVAVLCQVAASFVSHSVFATEYFDATEYQTAQTQFRETVVIDGRLAGPVVIVRYPEPSVGRGLVYNVPPPVSTLRSRPPVIARY